MADNSQATDIHSDLSLQTRSQLKILDQRRILPLVCLKIMSQVTENKRKRIRVIESESDDSDEIPKTPI